MSNSEFSSAFAIPPNTYQPVPLKIITGLVTSFILAVSTVFIFRTDAPFAFLLGDNPGVMEFFIAYALAFITSMLISVFIIRNTLPPHEDI